jgi:hypothetical protein
LAYDAYLSGDTRELTKVLDQVGFRVSGDR